MKKIVALAITALLFTACKKDRVCTCAKEDGTITFSSTFTNVTKREAKKNCVAVSADVTCKVK